jgi:hypothetical protein
VTRILARKLTRVEDDASVIIPPIKYDQWNEQLGKKMAAYHKQYQKFILKHKATEKLEEDSESVETDVMENLTKNVSHEKYIKKFYNDHSSLLKTELLQTVKLFEH